MLKLLSLFSGIGAFEKALDYLDVPYELVNYCEIDKYASKSYSLIHNVSEDKNLGDVTKVDTSKLPKDIDLITYGFPCQDISLAGKQKGFADDEGNITRSGLFFQALRIIEDCKPKIAIAENVKNLVSKKFKIEFNIVLNSLEAAGYNNYYKVLNAKDYGIPQNRERVFIVSIRKDIDTHNILEPFHFPEPFELKLRLKDMLEDEVDEKYYLSDAMIQYISFTGTKNYKNNDCRINLDVARPLTTKQDKRAGTTNYIGDNLPDNFDLRDTDKLIQIGNLKGGKWDKINESCRRVYDPDGLAPTIHTCQGGNTEPKILIKNATKQGYLEATEGDAIDISGRMEYHRGTVQKGISQTLSTAGGNNVGVVVKDKSSWTETQAKMITPEGNIKRYIDSDVVDEFKEGQVADISFPTRYGKGKRTHDECPAINGTTTANGFVTKITQCPLRIRKLTPKECFRLMGFEDDCIDVLIENGISNTQLYKQAGNSIVVDVLEEIFVELLNLQYINLN